MFPGSKRRDGKKVSDGSVPNKSPCCLNASGHPHHPSKNVFKCSYRYVFNLISLAFQSYIFEVSILYLWFVKHISLKKRFYSLENRIRYHLKTLFYLYGTSLLSPGNVPFLSGFNPFLGRKSLHTAFGNERKWRERPLLCPFGSWKSFPAQEIEWPKRNEYFLLKGD